MFIRLGTTETVSCGAHVEEKKNPALFHIFVMLILKDFGRGLGIVKQLVDFLHLLPLHGLLSLNTTQHAGWCQQLDSIPERKH